MMIIAFLGYDPRPVPAFLPERLVWYRQGKGWSQRRFAEVLGVDPTTLARWEKGERQPIGDYRKLGYSIIGRVGWSDSGF